MIKISTELNNVHPNFLLSNISSSFAPSNNHVVTGTSSRYYWKPKQVAKFFSPPPKKKTTLVTLLAGRNLSARTSAAGKFQCMRFFVSHFIDAGIAKLKMLRNKVLRFFFFFAKSEL